MFSSQHIYGILPSCGKNLSTKPSHEPTDIYCILNFYCYKVYQLVFKIYHHLSNNAILAKLDSLHESLFAVAYQCKVEIVSGNM